MFKVFKLDDFGFIWKRLDVDQVFDSHFWKWFTKWYEIYSKSIWFNDEVVKNNWKAQIVTQGHEL